MVSKTKHVYLPGFKGLPMYDVFKLFFNQLKKHSITERASAISYNIIMAFPPSLLFLLTLIPHLPFIPKESLRIQLHSLIFDIIPARVYNEQIIQFIDSFLDDNKIGLLSFGLALSLFFASNAMMGIIKTFSRDSFGFNKPKRLQMRGRALKITIMIFTLILSYLLLMVMQGKFLSAIVPNKDWQIVISYTRWLLILLLVFFAFAFIYRYAPAKENKWGLLSPGAVMATTLSILASVGFSAFVNNFGRYNALYGSIGTIMVIMAMIFINALSILLGFELNVAIDNLKNETDVKKNIPETLTEQ